MKAISFSYPCHFVNGKAKANTLFEARTARVEQRSLFGVPPLGGKHPDFLTLPNLSWPP
jgi:hypothetical protein